MDELIHILENFRRRPVTGGRVGNLAFVLDRSGSMGGGKFELARQAAVAGIERLTEDELASFFVLLCVAGNETPRNATAWGLQFLTENSDQRDRWLADLDGVTPTAVEEIVRMASPVIHFRRTATADGVRLGAPVVVVVLTDGDGAAVFPRELVRVGADASAHVVELHTSTKVDALVAPVLEATVGRDGHLRHALVQELGPRVWQLGHQAFRVEQSGRLEAFAAGLGGDYARTRTDCRSL